MSTPPTLFMGYMVLFTTDGISWQVTHIVDSTPVWYLSIMESRLMRPAIAMWCCYNSFCPPYVRSQASSSFQQALWQSAFLPVTSPDGRCWLISKLLSKQTQQQICNKVIVKGPTTPKSRCHITLWSRPTTIHASGYCCFSVICR